MLRDWFGSHARTMEMEEGSSVSDLLTRLAGERGSSDFTSFFRGIAVSVNAEYALAQQVLQDGDEIGLLPPVSGGNAAAETDNPAEIVVELTRGVIDAEILVARAKRGEDGAVAIFDGIVRNNTRGRQTLHLDYDAYEEMAIRQMNTLAREARTRFGVRHVALVHRLGRLLVGETSVLIVVASAHRAQAFDACRWLIDTLKKTVPIWKKETFVDGAVWSDGEPFPEGISIDASEAGDAT